MPNLPTTIGPLDERNTAGGCHLQFALADDIDTFPEEVNGTLGEITLLAGKTWITVKPPVFTQDFKEDWPVEGGAQGYAASLAFLVPKVRSAVHDGFKRLKPGRYVVLAHDHNNSTLVIGTKDEPAQLVNDSLAHGRGSNDKNTYALRAFVMRRTPCPLYGATPPEPGVPGGCPSMADLIAAASGDEVVNLIPTDQITVAGQAMMDRVEETADIIAEQVTNAGKLPALQAIVCSGGDVTIRDTADTTTVDTVAAPDTYLLPQSTIKYKDVSNASQELAPSDTLFDGTNLKPTTEIPRRALRNSAATGYGFATVDGIVNDTLPDAPDADIEINGTPVADAPAGTTKNLAVTDEAGTPTGSWNGVDQRWEVAAAGGDVTIRDTADTTTVAIVTAPDTYPLPQSVIKYTDAANSAAETAAANTEYDATHLHPSTVVPRRRVKNTAGNPANSTYADLDDLIADTIPVAQDATVKTTDGATTVATIPSNVTANLPGSRIKYKDESNSDAETASANTDYDSGSNTLRSATQIPRRELMNRNGTGMGVYATAGRLIADTVPNAPIPLKFAWAAGDADTYTWTVTDDEAGSYTTYTDDGGSGTVTYNKNGAGFSALSGTISLSVGDTIVLRRTTSTSNGWSKWA